MRATQRKKGRVTATPQELRKKTGAGANYSTSLGGSVTQYPFLVADFSADTVQGEACYRLDVDHNLNTSAYIWQCFKSENNSPIEVFDWHMGDNTLKLWFIGNSENVTVNIAG